MRLSRSSRTRAGFLVTALGAIALLTAATARADTCTWIGTTSTAWKTTTNWSGCTTAPNYPDTNDTAIINTGTPHDTPVIAGADSITLSGLTLNGNVTVNGTLTFAGGTMSGNGTLTITSGGNLVLNSGTLSGTGGITVSSGAGCSVGGGISLARPFSNAGTTTINSSGYISMSSGGSWTNTGTTDIQNDQGFYGSGQLFQNNSPGILKRSVSAGVAFVQPILNGNGAVQVNTGTLRLDGGGTVSGTFTFPGTTLELYGGTWAITADFSGGSGGTLYLYSDTAATFNSGASFSVSTINIGYGIWTFNTGTTVTPTNWTFSGSGTATGSDAFALQSGGTFTWGGGTMSGTGTTTIGAGRTLLLNNSGVTLQRKLVNQGTTTMNSNSYVSMSTGGSIDNSGTWEIQNDNGLYGSTQIFTNTGTVNRTTSAGTAFMQPLLNGSGGTVNVNSGTLRFDGGGTNSNNFNFAGATVEFYTGTFALTGDFKGDSGGTLLLYSATVTFNSGASLTPLSQLTASYGTVTFNTGTAITPSNFTQSGGTISGPDNMGVLSGGIYTWAGGTLGGTGTTTIDTGRQLILNSSSVTLQRPFINKGTGTMSGGSYLSISTGGTFNNQGTFEVQNDGYINGSGGQTFTNSGTFKRTTSAGTFTIYANTTNTGTIDVQTGDLNLYGTYTQTAGTLFLDGGNVDATSGQSLNIQGGVMKGDGSVNGDVSVSGTGQMSPGNSPGEISITNNHKYTQASPGVFNVDINGTTPGFDFDRILISGAATLGGELKVNLGYTPAVGDSFTILQHASRTGTFTKTTFPSPGAGLGWDLAYSATATTLSIAQMTGAFLKVDAHSGTGTTGDMNGVLEPGERVLVESNWLNMTESAIATTGTASNASGPAGATYTLNDTTADFGTIDADSTANCYDKTGDCYQFQVSTPAVRPATHWDASFKETITGGANKTWKLHVGKSFVDVPTNQTFYSKIETLLHTGITGGTDATHYSPNQSVNRAQMAIFIAKALAGGGANIPTSGQVSSIDYNCVAGGSSVYTDVLPTDSFCKQVHYIAALNVTGGCTATTFCPSGTLTRVEMAAFIAKAIKGGGPAIPITYGPDPVTGFSYSCVTYNPKLHFTDMKATDTFCKHVHYLWATGIIGGCSPTTYCPTGIVTRDAMAKFLVNAFSLLLYGPQ